MSQFKCPHCQGIIRTYPVNGGKKSKSSTFQSTATLEDFEPAQEVVIHSFWASDAVAYSIAGSFAGLVILGASWAYDFNFGGVIAAVCAFSVGIGLHVLKIVLHAPPKLPKPDTTTIKVEHWEDGRHILLGELDERITMELLRKVARAVMEKGANWSRPSLTDKSMAGITQGQFFVINEDFKKIGYVYKVNGNNHVLTVSGKAFLRKVLNS